MSYGVALTDLDRCAATYVDKILKRDGTFWYIGENQVGDMTANRGIEAMLQYGITGTTAKSLFGSNVFCKVGDGSWARNTSSMWSPAPSRVT